MPYSFTPYRFYLFFLAMIFLFSFNTLASEVAIDQKENPPKDPHDSFHSTTLREIKFFKDLPKGKYTIGYGKDSTGRKTIPLAIYDKMFPNLLDKRQLLKVFLSSIGVGDLNFYKLYERIKKHRLKKKNKALEDHFLKELFDEESKKKKLFFHADWWKNPKIKWKTHCLSKLKERPDNIPLHCIHIRKHALQDRFVGRIQKMMNDSIFGKDVWEGLQERSFFQKQEDGTYELVISEEKKIPPTKIIDLRGYNSSYKKAISWTVQTNIVKIGLTQLPFTVIPQLIAAILERFFNYIEVVYIFQQGEAMSMLVEASHHNESSPFFGVLSEEELKHSIQYLERHSFFFSGILKNLFAKKELIAQKFLDRIESKREKSLTYLEKKKYEIKELGQSFAFAVKRDSENEIDEMKVFSLLQTKTFRRKPHAVVDFLNPYREYFKRNFLEAVLVVTYFTSSTIPFLASLVRIGFKEIAIRKVQRYQKQEAGFRGYIDNNKDEIRNILMKEGFNEEEANEHIDSAYKIIKLRSLNPLVLDEVGRQKRKLASELWIKDHYEGYEPL